MRAYAMARQPPAGPVYLSIPMDDWKQSLDGYARVRTVSDRVAPDAERLWLFAGRISASRRPALVFGPEVDRGGGWDAAIALAEKLRAAVYGAPLLDRASFPEDHPLFRGPLGMSVRTVSDRHGTAADHRRPRGRRGRAGGRQPAGRPQAGDRPAPGPGHGGLSPDRPGADGPAPPASAGTEQPADPARGLRRAEPGQAPDAVIVNESTSTMAQQIEWLPTVRTGSFFATASGGIGWGVPAAVGVALGDRDRGVTPWPADSAAARPTPGPPRNWSRSSRQPWPPAPRRSSWCPPNPRRPCSKGLMLLPSTGPILHGCRYHAALTT